MAYIPKGRYLTVEQFRKRMGLTSGGVLTAIREGRIEGVIKLDARTFLIPEDAIVINNNLKHGRYIGVSAWLRGEIQHQEEVKDWERKQAYLRKQRENDKT